MNSKYLFGLKVPTNEWYWKYNLSYDEAIEKLKYMGGDFIMGHNEANGKSGLVYRRLPHL